MLPAQHQRMADDAPAQAIFAYSVAVQRTLLDLAQFHAETAYLDLVIDASQVIELLAADAQHPRHLPQAICIEQTDVAHAALARRLQRFWQHRLVVHMHLAQRAVIARASHGAVLDLQGLVGRRQVHHAYAVAVPAYSSRCGALSLVAPNHLQRQFDVKEPNRVRVADITYI